MSSTAWSPHMAGDARPCLELRGVFLNEVQREDARDPHTQHPWSPGSLEQVYVILLRSR